MMPDSLRCEHTRDAYGETLVELGKKDPRIVVLDADTSLSTKTDGFARAFPERFFNVGIAEQNMVNIAAGLARGGKIPFVSTFSMFGCGRAWEQIRNTVALDGLNVKLVMTHAGFSLGGDGSTHQSLEDVAIMRVIPRMHVIIPADVPETRAVVRYAAGYRGPVYIRLSRRRTLVVNPEEYGVFRPDLYPVLREGHDVTLLTNGCMIRESLMAASALEKEGISTRVVNMHTVKPLAGPEIVRAARETGRIVTVEEHSVIGGIGSAVAEFLAERYPVPMRLIGVHDSFGGSGLVEELYRQYGISQDAIARSVRDMISAG